MSDVQFDEGQYSQTSFNIPKPSKMASLVISTGLAKDEKGANIVLIGFIGVLVVIFFIAINSGPSNTYNPNDTKIDQPTLDAEAGL